MPITLQKNTLDERGGAERVVLHDVSWETYESLLRDYENSSSPRMTYDRGALEIVSPLIIHEETNRTLQTLVETILDVWEWDYRNLGSTTFKRQDKKKGIEPDTCFYVKNRAAIGNKETLDLPAGDPPPDLVIEIDVSHSSVPKMPLLAAFGVLEVWRYRKTGVKILTLDKQEYKAALKSLSLPTLDSMTLNDLLKQSRVTSKAEWLRAVRTWANANKPQQKP